MKKKDERKIDVRREIGDPRPQECYPTEKRLDIPKTMCDLQVYKTIRIDGKVFPGVQGIDFSGYHVGEGPTTVTMKFVIARNGLSINGANVDIKTCCIENVPKD